MRQNIVGQVVVITGCSTGIGLETAKLLKAQGARVICTTRKKTDMARLQDEHGLQVVLMDMGSIKSINTGFESIMSLTGNRLDILFHNAGFAQPGAVEDLPTAALKKQFDVNFFGVHELTRLALPVMHGSADPRIIVNSSVLGMVAMPFRAAYNASKFALEGWADTLRLELADSPIKVSLLQPGPVNTAFRKNALSAFEKNIEEEGSRYRQRYAILRSKFSAPKSLSQYAKSAEECAEEVLKVIMKDRPGSRYPFTVPSHVMSLLKNFVPSFILDRILAKGI